tara:strand:+ start:116 stop:523 length:408 start_codon:yes stop_codon:yes gene_type:complete
VTNSVTTIQLLAALVLTGPPPCTETAGWVCLDRDHQARVARFVARCEALPDIYEVELGAADARHETVLRATRARHAAEVRAWTARQAALVDLVKQAEHSLAKADRGHPTWVVWLSAVGGVVVGGVVVGLLVRFVE